MKMKYKIPRLMIAAEKSGCGKTAICALLVNLLQKKGHMPAMFKCGPDYLDPLFHERINGIKPGNLDSYFCDKNELSRILYTESRGCRVAVVEGVMGYYDGKGSTMAGSSAELADILDLPVVLIVDAKGAMQSNLAVIKGFLTFHQYGEKIRGIILNKSSKKVFEVLKKEIEAMGVSALGYVEKTSDLEFPSRYLGVVTPQDDSTKAKIERALDKVHIDLEKLLDLADGAGENEFYAEAPKAFAGKKVAIAKDEAFCFLYRENISLLEEAGVEIKYFSPIYDLSVPEADALILPGGYPEDYASLLSQNTAMRESVKSFIAEGKPAIAECGGYMYLHRKLITADGKSHDMAGVVDGTCRYEGLCRDFGYKQISASENWLLAKPSEVIKGHVFHHFVSDANTVMTKKLYAGFCHIPFAGNRNALYSFLEAMQ